jgi:hypothetical protein
MSRRVRQDSYTYIEDGQPYTEWEDTSRCLACHKGWTIYEIQIPGCRVCGVNHSGDIAGGRVRCADGKDHESPYFCQNCDTYTDQTTGEITVPVPVDD